MALPFTGTSLVHAGLMSVRPFPALSIRMIFRYVFLLMRQISRHCSECLAVLTP